jgi:hypothetical protein
MMGQIKAKKQARKGKTKEPGREERIEMDIMVDCYGAQEQAMGWYYYLENNIEFPFVSTCVKKKGISPLKLKERVEVVGLPPIEICDQEMFVEIIWNERRFAVPLDQLEYAGRDKEARQAVEDWHYWVRQGYQFG